MGNANGLFSNVKARFGLAACLTVFLAALVCAGPVWAEAEGPERLSQTSSQPSSAPNDKLSWWAWVVPSAGNPKDQEIMAAARALWARIVVPEGADVLARADAIRLFVNAHSVHRIDDEFYSYWHDMPYLMTMMDKRAALPAPRVDRAPRPHMECATRSVMMYHLLRLAGIEARFVVVHANRINRENHTFLEVRDPADGRWTVQDPDANVYWRFADGRRAGVKDLLREPVRKNFMPCRAAEDCGYNDYIDVFVPHLAAALIIDPRADDVTLLHNPQRVDWYNVMRSTRNEWTFCVLYKGECNYKVVAVP